MTFRLRGYWAFVFSVLLALSSGTLLVTQGKMRDVSGRMVLCTGHGPVSVAVDSQGQPVDPSPVCPDFVPLVVGWADDVSVFSLPETISFIRFEPARFALVPVWPRQAKKARAPPMV
jgi:hypothetical protein